MPNDGRASSQPVDGRYILPMKRQVVRQVRPIRQLLFEDGHDPIAAPGQFSRRHCQLRTCSASLRSTSSCSQKFPITLQSRCAKSRAGTGFERNGERSLGSLIVCRLLVDRTANLNFLGDRSYAIDALDRAFGRDLLGIAGDVSGERHDAVTGTRTFAASTLGSKSSSSTIVCRRVLSNMRSFPSLPADGET